MDWFLIVIVSASGGGLVGYLLAMRDQAMLVRNARLMPVLVRDETTTR